MRKFDGKPQKAIAAELRISENIVEKRMSRALRMILEQLQASEGELENGSGIDRIERKDRRGA
jgi:DNA-directed RNA polymerase specialized sigma24 family protein